MPGLNYTQVPARVAGIAGTSKPSRWWSPVNGLQRQPRTRGIKNMRNKTKGWIAGGLGATLLLGTAGTFALWSDTETIGGADVTGGTFELTADDISWELRPLAGEGTASVPDEGVTLVPGVQLHGEVSDGIQVDLEGDLLVADLQIATGNVPAPDWLTVEWTLGNETVTGPTATFEDVDDAESIDLSVSVRLTNQHPTGGPSEVSGLTWAAEDITVTLQQVAPVFS
jgi:alternate signal-mediated exported protein